MVRELKEGEIVEMIQRTLPEKAFAVAYFSRSRKYSYQVFENIEELITFLCDKDIDDVWMQDNRTVTFLSDEWFVFSSEEKASQVFKFVKDVINKDNDV